MSALASTVATPALAESFMDCVQLFARFLLALGEHKCRAICLGQVDVQKVLDEYGRFKIWGEQSKADLPARARGSLDDTLRHDDELKQVVRDIFMRLNVLLSQTLPVAKRKWDSGAGTDQDSVSSVSAESSSDLDSDADDRVRPRQTMPKIKLLVRQIFEQIQSLYDLSSLLRRPKIVDRYIRSLPKSGTRTVTESFPEELTLSAAFAIWDEKHVHEKLQQWQGVTKAGRSDLFDDEDVATEMPSSEDESPTPIPWLQERLARANTRRREQLRYWIDHPYDPNQDNLGSNVTEPELVKVQVIRDDGSQVSTLKKDGPAPPSQGPKSVKTTQSFSTVAMSDIHDTKTNVRPRTVYAPTEMGQGKVNSVPGPPKPPEGKSTFTCPYCGISLEWSEMQNRQSWKRHVFRDLRPYVCTFEDCQNGGKLYASRHDWTYHELQLHRREYRCRQCDQKHNARKEMAAHLKTHYGDSFPAARLSVALDLCDRQVDILSAKDSCIFCGDELLLSALQGHTAAHMEDISLFVLPSTADDGDAPEAHSKASIQASWTRTWSSRSRQTSIGIVSDPEDQDSEAERSSKRR
ncbi:C2H2 type zinc finger domain protein [Rhypophila decipiens]